MEYRRWFSSLVVARRRAESQLQVVGARCWIRYSALNGQLGVIGEFVMDASRWPEDGASSSTSVDEVLAVLWGSCLEAAARFPSAVDPGRWESASAE